MIKKSVGAIITKEDIKKEIKKENRIYKKGKSLAAIAVLLVLVALILLFIYAKKENVIGGINQVKDIDLILNYYIKI